jgi:hypothetical protein
LFEGDTYTVSFEFGSPQDLEEIAARLITAARSGNCGKIFELLGRPPEDGEHGL